jgi:hypothetical protein
MAHCKRDHATLASRGLTPDAGSARASPGRGFTPHVPSTFPRQGLLTPREVIPAA